MGSNNGTEGDLLADVQASGEKGYVRGISELKKMDNYEDGAGREVRASFEHFQGGLIGGWMPTPDRLLEFSYERNEFEDALYPGAGMDSPEESGDIFRLRYKDAPALSWLSNIDAELYLSDVDHVMDNFSLRNPPKYEMMHAKAGQDMRRETRTTSKTAGGRVSLTTDSGSTRWIYGVDMQANERDAALANMDSGDAKAISLMWPDAGIRQAGIFVESDWALAPDQRLKAGVRLDSVDASADKADIKPVAGPKTANQVYQMYYGVTAEDQDETNLGGLLRYERDAAGSTLAVGLSRSVRTADASERYMNKWGMTGAQRWVGNPAIEPEVHHQFDLVLNWKGDSFSGSGVLFYDNVEDYILRDAARGQTGILLADNADIYRNVDAELYGVELESRWRVDSNLDIAASLAYVRATNTSDDRPIAQTPPLNGTLQADYKQGIKWGVGARLDFARSQTRIDESSKQEVGETAGFGVLDIYGHYYIDNVFHVRIGVDNAFDREYAQHLNRANVMDTQAFKVNEPGRTAWLKLGAEFY